MEENTKLQIFVLSGISALLAAIGVILAFAPVTINYNTPQDEPKISELAKEHCMVDQMRTYNTHREAIIDESYSRKEIQGFNRQATKILLTIAALPLAAVTLLFFLGIYEGSGIKGYFAARAEYWKQRSKKESKILDELIELQKKISGVE